MTLLLRGATSPLHTAPWSARPTPATPPTMPTAPACCRYPSRPEPVAVVPTPYTADFSGLGSSPRMHVALSLLPKPYSRPPAKIDTTLSAAWQLSRGDLCSNCCPPSQLPPDSQEVWSNGGSPVPDPRYSPEPGAEHLFPQQPVDMVRACGGGLALCRRVCREPCLQEGV